MSGGCADRALDVLGRLVQRQNNVLFGFKHFQSLELQVYRNQILHIFGARGLAARSRRTVARTLSESRHAALHSLGGAGGCGGGSKHAGPGRHHQSRGICALVREGALLAAPLTPASGRGVSRARLLDGVKFLSQLFKLEFIYKPVRSAHSAAGDPPPPTAPRCADTRH
jgi:hypothetical protein